MAGHSYRDIGTGEAVDISKISVGEFSDPIRYDAHPSQEPDTPGASSGELLTISSELLVQDAIAKMNAGAQLTLAVWSLPKDVVTHLFKHAPAAFVKAYGTACEAYGVGDA